jgi:2-dehydropantoate 2-reductase
MKVHVVGAGAIGGLAGAWMSRAGVDVTFVDVDREHVQALRSAGVVINGARGCHRLPPQRALTPDELAEPLGCVFLAVQSQHTAEASRWIEPRLRSDGVVVSLQNGVMNENVIASVIGRERTIGGLPDYGGARVAPGELEQAIDGPVYVGELHGGVTPRLREIARLLSHVAECHVLTDITARIWAKACYGGRIATTTLVDAPTHAVMMDARTRRVAVPVIQERLQLAHAHGVEVPAGPYFDPALYFPKTSADTRRLFASLDEAMERLNRHRQQTERDGYRCRFQASGFHWDIVHRHRPSELRWSDGPLEEAAAARGLPFTVNRRLHQMVYEIEDGRRAMGWSNIEELLELVRSLGKDLP